MTLDELLTLPIMQSLADCSSLARTIFSIVFHSFLTESYESKHT